MMFIPILIARDAPDAFYPHPLYMKVFVVSFLAPLAVARTHVAFPGRVGLSGLVNTMY